jgi:prepilin-type N-terminal cleavage/methylation domain-containing protein
MKNKKRKGFTLIELLVVMAIMGILTIITVSQFKTARWKAFDVQRKGDLSALRSALLTYYADYNEFPDQINENSGDVTECSSNESCYQTSEQWCTDLSCEFKDDSGEVEGIYMKVLPRENKDEYPPYCYVVSADNKQFALYGILQSTNDSDCRCVEPKPSEDPVFIFQDKCE